MAGAWGTLINTVIGGLIAIIAVIITHRLGRFEEAAKKLMSTIWECTTKLEFEYHNESKGLNFNHIFIHFEKVS